MPIALRLHDKGAAYMRLQSAFDAEAIRNAAASKKTRPIVLDPMRDLFHGYTPLKYIRRAFAVMKREDFTENARWEVSQGISLFESIKPSLFQADADGWRDYIFGAACFFRGDEV
jgi:hypothetical protein